MSRNYYTSKLYEWGSGKSPRAVAKDLVYRLLRAGVSIINVGEEGGCIMIRLVSDTTEPDYIVLGTYAPVVTFSKIVDTEHDIVSNKFASRADLLSAIEEFFDVKL